VPMVLALIPNITHYVSGHWWAYAVVFGACALDSLLFFLVPSEAVTIAAGVLAGQGHLAIWWVVAAAAVGVFAGDNSAYGVGRLVGDAFAEWVCRYDRGRRWLGEGRKLIERHGEAIILAGRFVPAGRSAATISAGMIEFPWRRFARADAPAAVAWAVYASMLGYFGGSTFENSFWKPFVIALGVAVLVGGGAELWRRLQKRRGRDMFGDDVEEAPSRDRGEEDAAPTRSTSRDTAGRPGR
jgi:membrane-associated protein